MKTKSTLLPLLAISLGMGAGYSHFLGALHWRITIGGMAGATCGGAGWLNCSDTLGGRYSEILGLPVSIYAEAWFGFLLALLVGGLWRKEPRRKLCQTLFWAIVPGVGVTLAYIALSALVLHALCLYCGGLYFLVGLSAVLAFWGMEVPSDIRQRLKGAIRQFCQVWALPLVLFAGIILAERKLAAPQAPVIASSNSSPGVFSDDKDGLPRIASDRAVLHVTEFVDFECPACRYSARELDRFMAGHPGAVELRCAILMSSCRHETGRVPPQAVCLAARIGAVMQNRKLFWPYYKAVMLADRVIDEALIWEVVEGLVGKEQVASVRMELDQPAAAAVLQRNSALAESNKIDQTPSWIINQRLEVGAKTEAAWEKLLTETRKQPPVPSERSAGNF